MKKQRSRIREGVHANQEMENQINCERVVEELRKGEVHEDLDCGFYDLSCTFLFFELPSTYEAKTPKRENHRLRSLPQTVS